MNEETQKIDLTYFPNFIRTLYADIDFCDDAIKEIGEDFKVYLIEKEIQVKYTVFALDPRSVIERQSHPLYTKGYHPALVLIFSNYIRDRVENKFD